MSNTSKMNIFAKIVVYKMRQTRHTCLYKKIYFHKILSLMHIKMDNDSSATYYQKTNKVYKKIVCERYENKGWLSIVKFVKVSCNSFSDHF